MGYAHIYNFMILIIDESSMHGRVQSATQLLHKLSPRGKRDARDRGSPFARPSFFLSSFFLS